MPYLRLDLGSHRRYTEVQGVPGNNEFAIALSRTDRRVIYGPRPNAVPTLANNDNLVRANMIVYDDDTYRKRRILCDSALGLLMLDNPRFTNPALNRVREGIQQFMTVGINNIPMHPTDVNTRNRKLVLEDGKYVSKATSFGRLDPSPQPQPHPDNVAPQEIARWLAELNTANANIAKTMSLHNIFLKIYVRAQYTMNISNVVPSTIRNDNWRKPKQVSNTMESERIGLREGWYDNKELRGRVNVDGVRVTDKPWLIAEWVDVRTLARAGVANNGHGSHYGQRPLTERKRGIDMFAKSQNAPATAYFQGLAANRLNFSASASGTTSTLLTSAQTFYPGIVNNLEHTKQYVMACIAYLVGGGMHTCHEVFYTAGLVPALNYQTGRYDQMLPNSFLQDPLYHQWYEEFIDVIEGKG